jgi:DNA repair exonuclease SbcCD ATPase subunit
MDPSRHVNCQAAVPNRTKMKKSLTLLAILAAFAVNAQTEVRNASFTFAGGVYPTYSVVFNGTDKVAVEKWFKDQLKPISTDMGGKKEVMSIGTRMPEVSSDTMRVFVKADQPKGSKDVTAHVAFRVNNAFIGPDSEERQREACRSWMYQNAVMLKKNIAQKDLEAGQKQLAHLESELSGLVKEKDRAENSTEKTRDRIVEDEKEKIDTEAASSKMETTVASKQQEVTTAPTEENQKELQSLLKEQEKLRKKTAKLTESIADGKKKVEDLQFQIKQNLSAQDAKTKAIEAQKKVVEELTTKLAGIN